MTQASALTVSPEPDDDPTFYPTTSYRTVDDMPEGVVQSLITEVLRPLIQRYLDARGDVAFVGADQFMYYIKGNPRACTSPDVYVMPGVRPADCRRIGSWKIWQTKQPPTLAIEIMSESDDGHKDEEKSPQRHDVMGTKELVVFDPYVDELSGRTRFRVFRRNKLGRLELVQVTNIDRVWCETLGCYLRAVGASNDVRLRLATGTDGETLFPTEAEAQAMRADEEARRASDAEAELARLRAQIAELQRRS